MNKDFIKGLKFVVILGLCIAAAVIVIPILFSIWCAILPFICSALMIAVGCWLAYVIIKALGKIVGAASKNKEQINS